jgi:hypothetical protein
MKLTVQGQVLNLPLQHRRDACATKNFPKQAKRG